MKYILPILAVLITSTAVAATDYKAFFSYYTTQKETFMKELETLNNTNFSAEKTNTNYNFTINTTDAKARKDELMKLLKSTDAKNLGGGCFSNGGMPLPYGTTAMPQPQYNCNLNAAFMDTQAASEVVSRLSKMSNYSDMNENTYTDMWRQNSVEQYKMNVMSYLNLLELADDAISISDVITLSTALNTALMNVMNTRMNVIDPNMNYTTFINIQINSEMPMIDGGNIMMDSASMPAVMPTVREKAAPTHPL